MTIEFMLENGIMAVGMETVVKLFLMTNNSMASKEIEVKELIVFAENNLTIGPCHMQIFVSWCWFLQVNISMTGVMDKEFID